jgi:hypothetical protein
MAPITTKSTLTQPSGSETSLQGDTSHQVTLTSGQSLTLNPTISEATPNATSSQALPDGATPSGYRCGLTIDLFGQAPAPANPSPQPEKAKHQAMNATSGPTGLNLSELADRQSSLANRLKRQLDGVGSTLFSLTWRKKATPLGRPYYQLAASGRRISDSDCGSWPTPQAKEQKESAEKKKARGANAGLNLRDACELASWPTPDQGERGAPRYPEKTTRENGTKIQFTLNAAVSLVGWSTPQAGDYKGSSGAGARERGGFQRRLGNDVQTLGETSSGSHAQTESKGQLNPAFSLWLMGYPEEWLNSAPPATRSSRKSRQSS